MAVGKLAATSRANVGPERMAAGVCAEKVSATISWSNEPSSGLNPLLAQAIFISFDKYGLSLIRVFLNA